jgi:hypothetical protein
VRLRVVSAEVLGQPGWLRQVEALESPPETLVRSTCLRTFRKSDDHEPAGDPRKLSERDNPERDRKMLEEVECYHSVEGSVGEGQPGAVCLHRAS